LSVGKGCTTKAPEGLLKGFDYFFPLKSNGPRRLLRRIIIIIKDIWTKGLNTQDFPTLAG